MDMSAFTRLFNSTKPVIGMLHLLPLPGAPGAKGIADIRRRLMGDAHALAEGGVDGLIIENYGDAPYFPGRVPPQTVSFMTLLAAQIKQQFSLPLGINVLRNDGMAALAIAASVEAQFIRVNVYMGARIADEGIIQGQAHEIVRTRELLAPATAIFADVDVKHSIPLGKGNLSMETQSALTRGKADAVVVSGPATGKETRTEDLEFARSAAGSSPILVGSGVNAANVALMLALAEGVIVGSAFKKEGNAANPVDPTRVKELMLRAKG